LGKSEAAFAVRSSSLSRLVCLLGVPYIYVT